jgi:hypothetical protein
VFDKQDSIRHRKDQNGFELTIALSLCALSMNIQEYTHSHCIQIQRGPQRCQAREHRCRQLLQLVAVERQIAVAKQKAEKIISTRKQDNKHHRQVWEQLVLPVCLRMGELRFEFDLCSYRQEYTHSHLTDETSRMSCWEKRLQVAAEACCS